jgi:hypothetical protein
VSLRVRPVLSYSSRIHSLIACRVRGGPAVMSTSPSVMRGPPWLAPLPGTAPGGEEVHKQHMLRQQPWHDHASCSQQFSVQVIMGEQPTGSASDPPAHPLLLLALTSCHPCSIPCLTCQAHDRLKAVRVLRLRVELHRWARTENSADVQQPEDTLTTISGGCDY